MKEFRNVHSGTSKNAGGTLRISRIRRGKSKANSPRRVGELAEETASEADIIANGGYEIPLA